MCSTSWQIQRIRSTSWAPMNVRIWNPTRTFNTWVFGGSDLKGKWPSGTPPINQWFTLPPSGVNDTYNSAAHFLSAQLQSQNGEGDGSFEQLIGIGVFGDVNLYHHLALVYGVWVYCCPIVLRRGKLLQEVHGELQSGHRWWQSPLIVLLSYPICIVNRSPSSLETQPIDSGCPCI